METDLKKDSKCSKSRNVRKLLGLHILGVKVEKIFINVGRNETTFDTTNVTTPNITETRSTTKNNLNRQK